MNSSPDFFRKSLREKQNKTKPRVDQVSRDLRARFRANTTTVNPGAARRAACPGKQLCSGIHLRQQNPGRGLTGIPRRRTGLGAGTLCFRRRLGAGRLASGRAEVVKRGNMDDEEETYRLWKIRKTIMQASCVGRF